VLEAGDSRVCGIQHHAIRDPRTSFTVSETPSSVTEPFAAKKAPLALCERDPHQPRVALRLDRGDFRHAVDVPAHHVPAQAITDAQRLLEVQLTAGAARDQKRRLLAVSIETSASKLVGVWATTVRHAPLTANRLASASASKPNNAALPNHHPVPGPRRSRESSFPVPATSQVNTALT